MFIFQLCLLSYLVKTASAHAKGAGEQRHNRTAGDVGAGGGSLVGDGNCGGQIAQAQCDVWHAFFDATGGSGWNYCSDNRDSPCDCSVGWSWTVSCANNGITSMYVARPAAPSPYSPRASPPQRT